jgi:hypothetical protein
MCEVGSTDIASIISSTVIGCAVAFIAWRQWRTERERLIHDRFDKRFAVYRATDDFVRKAYTTGVGSQDIIEFYGVTKEAYFLFDDSLGSYLENQIFTKGNEIQSMDIDAVRDPTERTTLVQRRRELTEWMRHQRTPVREKFARFLRS